MRGWPAYQVSAPDEYPAPGPGPVTTWRLRTPAGEPVGTLAWDEVGVSWTPASTEDPSAQEHAAEVLAYLRGNRAQGTPLADALAGVRDAYAGDLDEDPASGPQGPPG